MAYDLTQRAFENLRVPPFKPRRPLDDKYPDGYLESDKDWVNNNFELCVKYLESLED